ncbi:MAG: GntR family transcriptional regulator, partial [Muribaculaceae bacterium]|nr:GntR family transcriptional regulator [Muribaculaceae bacterium]
RIVASAKIEHFLGNVMPEYKPGDKVKALVYEHTEIGYKVIVDNLHRGIIYHNEIFRPVELEESVTAFVKQVRPDGKVDLTLSDIASRRTAGTSEKIIEYLSTAGHAPVGDKTSPEIISMIFGCSKKDFKKAVGRLYKERKIAIAADGTIVLI